MRWPWPILCRVPIAKTVPLLLLMNELNRLKDKSGIRDSDAALHLGCRASKINRIMLGQSRISAGDTKMLAELYGAAPALVDALVELARGLARRGEWTTGGLLPELERHSARVRQVTAEIVPALLRTEEYALALCRASVVGENRLPESVLDRVPEAAFVLSESCLRRAYADRTTMRDQLLHLAAMADLPNVQLQVLPFDRPAVHAGRGFELIDVPGPDPVAPLNVAYTDDGYVDDPDAVHELGRLWDSATTTALTPAQSSRFVRKVAAEYR